jgi:hypothetical protein
MTDQQERREMFDNLAQQTIEAAQQMMRRAPEMPPTECYKLAITYSFEILAMQLELQYRMAFELMIANAKRRAKEND